MIRVCSTCGTENGPTAVHCRNCRAKLQEPNHALALSKPTSRWRSLLRGVLRDLVLLFVGVAAFWLKENVSGTDARSDARDFFANGRVAWSNALSSAGSWYAKWLSAEPAPPPPPPAPTSPPPETAKEVKVRCPRCNGLGYAILKKDKVIEDLTGAKRKVTETRRAVCQLCAQEGGRTVVVPPGAEICPACAGLGKIMTGLGGQESVQHCQICFGKGYVVRRY